MTSLSFVAFLTCTCLSAGVLMSAERSTNELSVEILGTGYYHYTGSIDSSGPFFDGITEASVKGVQVELSRSQIPKGLLEFVKRTTITVNLTLVGFTESDISHVLESVAQPESILGVDLYTTSFSKVPDELRRFSSLTHLGLDTITTAIPCWVPRDMVMLSTVDLGRGTVNVDPCPSEDVNPRVYMSALDGRYNSAIDRDSLYQHNGIWIGTADGKAMNRGASPFDAFKEIEVWNENGRHLGIMNFEHCTKFGEVLSDQIENCRNDRVPFTDKDPARCAEYLELVRTKRVLRVDLVPEGVLIERTFLVTGNQAKRLRRFIDCSWK